jgi:hypothetical protein
MKFLISDFSLLRWSLVAMCTSLVLSGVILYGSAKYADQNSKILGAARLQISEARKRLADTRDARDNLSAYSAEYGELEQHDLIGDDHRLDWMEGLEKLRHQNLVIDFRYNIAPQKNYVAQPAIESGNFNIHYSEMKLQFDLLHEGQLLRFFDVLHNQVSGYYQLVGCKLLRNDVANAATPSAHLKAECSGGWITLKNRTALP